jgi:hypothetical protein
MSKSGPAARQETYSKPPREGVGFLAHALNSASFNSIAGEPHLCRASGFALTGYEEVIRGRTLKYRWISGNET